MNFSELTNFEYIIPRQPLFYQTFKNKIAKIGILLLGMSFILLLFSCSPTRYVPEGKYLLDNVKIIKDNKNIEKKNLSGYIKQKPNKRILGFRFHLGLYNLSNINKEKGFNNWLREIGEDPVIYDDYQTEKSVKQLSLYLKNKGYFYATIDDTVLLKNKRANVNYTIISNKPYKIRKLNYEFEDTTLRKIILKDTANSFIKKGILFDADMLQSERQRIENLLKNQGYFNFSKEYIFYNADTAVGNYQADILMVIRKYMYNTQSGQSVSMAHPQYFINHVLINTAFVPQNSINPVKSKLLKTDTTTFENLQFVYHNKPIVKKNVLSQTNYLLPGEIYRLSNSEETYKHFSSLRIFRYINIEVDDNSNPTSDTLNPLDCQIQLIPSKLQSYSVEVEGTNSSGNIGAAGNIIYTHNNLFAGAEIFDVRLRGGFETFNKKYNNLIKTTLELGAEVSLRVPKFIVPFKSEQFIKKFNPKTNFSVSYNYQRRPDYTRTIANGTFGYTWRGNKYVVHTLNPVEENLVKLHQINPEFQSEINKYPLLKSSYQSHMVSVTSYNFVFNNQRLGRNTNFSFLKIGLESAGNILEAWNSWVLNTPEGIQSRFLGTEYAQYLKADFDVRYYQSLNATDKVVYRVFAGAGYPYGNSKSLPFEKKYFTGGANGIRAWQVRDLGPGSYSGDKIGTYPNQTGDIKIEANVEYRFKLFWVLEGALFADAGNIWSIMPDAEQEGAQFKLNEFIQQMAVGTGFGMRFDFSFFIFRLDIGMKLRDPAAKDGNRWIPTTRGYSMKDFALQIGIGYPF